MKKLNTNVEVYNYLNIVCRRLGKLYKVTGYSPLPSDFDIDKEKFKEAIILGQMQKDDIFPPFNYEDRNEFKKYLKNSLKNCQKIIKNGFFAHFSTPKFAKRLELYFEMRAVVTQSILKDFKDHDFDEVAAYREIYNLEPLLGEFFENLFEEKADIEAVFTDLERKYRATYLEKVKLLEKKNFAKMKAQVENTAENLKATEKSKNLGKIAEKNAKSAKNAKHKQDVKNVKAQIKETKESAGSSTTTKKDKVKE